MVTAADERRSITLTHKGSQTKEYTASGLDQYGHTYYIDPTWTLEGEPAGVSIDSNGIVSVRQGAVATKNIKVVATSKANNMSGSTLLDLVYAEAKLHSIQVEETGVPASERTFTLHPVFYDQFGREIEKKQALPAGEPVPANG